MSVDIQHPDFMKNNLTMQSKIAYLASGEGIHIRFDLDDTEKPKWILTLDDGEEISITSENLDLETALDEAIDYTNKTIAELVKEFQERESEA